MNLVGRETAILLVAVVVCLELPTSVSAQRASGTSSRRTQQQPVSSGVDLDGDGVPDDLSQVGGGGSIRISSSKQRTKLKTVYIDETDLNVPSDELAHEQHHIYIESEDEKSEWSTVIPLGGSSRSPPRPPPVVPPVQGRWMNFNGSMWILVDMSKMPEDFVRRNELESFNITFTTTRPDQLIWFTGNDRENVHLTLKNGILYLIVTRNGREDQTMRIQSDQRLDDGRAHQVSVTRMDRRVTVSIDGQSTVNTVRYLTYDADLIGHDNHVFLGGNADTSRLTRNFVSNNFQGTVRKAILSGDTLPHDIDILGLALVQPTPVYIIINGQADDDTDLEPTTSSTTSRTTTRRAQVTTTTTPRPTRRPVIPTAATTQRTLPPPVRRGETSVTFDSGRNYLRLPGIWASKFNGSVDFSFRTLEPDGVIMATSPRPGRRDFFALELVDGTLVALYNFGSEKTQSFVLATGVNDGQPHRVRIDREGRQLILTFDNEEQHDVIDADIDDVSLDLGSNLYVGGADNTVTIPWSVISRRRDRFYRGCLWDLRFDGGPLVELMGERQSVAGMQARCVPAELGRCATGGEKFCQHNTICHERWDGPVCDCSRSAYTGTQCQTDAPLLALRGGTGYQLIKANVRPRSVTHTNDISVQFRTAKKDGVLFATSNAGNDGYVKAYLEDGHVVVEMHIPGAGNDVRLSAQCEYPVNDNEWHYLYIKRRAGNVEAYVDNCRPVEGFLPGEDFTLDIDQIVIGKVDENERPETSFYGNIRNFFIDNSRPFDRLRSDELVDPVAATTIRPVATTRRRPLPPVQPTEPEDDTIIPDDPVTFPPNYNAYIRVTADRVRNIDDQRVRFLFRTNERQGLLAYSVVPNEGWYLAIELRDGVPRVDYDDGRGPQVVVAPSSMFVADGEWHEFDLCSAGPGTNQIMIKIDTVDVGVRIDVTSPLLFQTLYVGGLPEGRPDRITRRAAGDTRRGFVGCISVLIVNGRRYDLTEIATRSDIIKPGCTLSTPVVHCGGHQCQHRGACVEQLNGYICDCNLTSWAGPYCNFEAEGFLFSENLGPGIVIYTLQPPRFTDRDKVAFGVMTRQLNGTLLRLDSGIVDFIEFKLENGYLVVQYDLGNSEQRLVESRIKINDGNYHYITYIRNRESVTLQVDDLPIRRKAHDPAAMMFNHLAAVKIGGKYDINDQITNHFDGIIAGVYVSDSTGSVRVIDKHVFEHSSDVHIEGDVRVADHLFTLPVRRFTVKPTPELPDVIEEPKPEVPKEPDGGRIDVDGEKIPPPGPEPGVNPDPSGGGIVHEGEGPGGSPEKARLVGAGVGIGSLGSGGSGLDPTGTRAVAVAGAMLGILAAISSLVWALYQFKPGLIPLGGFGGGGAGNTMVISAPQEATMLLTAEKAAPVSSGFAGGSGGGQSAVTVIRGGGAGSGSGGGSSTNFAQHFSAISSSSSAAGGRGAAGGYGGGFPPEPPIDEDMPLASAPPLRSSPPRGPGSQEPLIDESATSPGSANALYATPGAGSGFGSGGGTMHRGIQTEFVDGGQAVASARGGVVSLGAAGGSSTSYIESTAVRNVYSSQQQASSGSGFASSAGGYDASGSAAGYQTSAGAYASGTDTANRYGHTLSGGDAMITSSSSYAYEQRSAGGQANGYIPSSPTSPMDSSMFGAGSTGVFQMKNMALSSAAATTNLMTTAEQIRVDCVQLTNNGRYVVTGSIFGPPQVWDLKTGELVNMMAGEELSSTDLRLANGDTLLVGQVAEVEQVDSADIAAANRLHYRKLQIWDFETGRPMEMRKNESCTASCMMTDGERMVLARTERFSTGITVIIWDVLGNEPIRYLKYDSATGIADHISYVGVSRDNRFVVAGYQNSYDGHANFVIFDLNEHDAAGAKVLALTAVVDVTSILDNHEAVTGTLAGELVIWSLRTGKVQRQLVPSGASAAHDREVKGLAVSKDVSLLVSASADSTLKIWNIENDKLQMTLSGHKDEVWCCAISNDNELVVSGSRDHTIRLWRTSDGAAVAAIDAGVDIFKVLVSNNKRTVVALADRFAARKLVMLQIVRTKTSKSITSSRSTIVQQQVVA